MLYKQFFVIVVVFFSGISIVNSQSIDSLSKEDIQQLFKIQDSIQVIKDIRSQALIPGVRQVGDSLVFSKEYLKLLKNSEYRAQVFKQPYTFEIVLKSLANQEFQKACWYLLYLYPENKELVIKTLYSYSNLLEIEKIVTFSVYTYGFFDPEISQVVNGKPEIYRPDILEERLIRAKEIVNYIVYFRQEAKKKEEEKNSNN